MVSGGREYESIRMTFPGDPYNNELSFNWYGSAWRMRTERSSAEITDLSFWKTTGAGVTTEKMRIDGDGYVKATGFKTQNRKYPILAERVSDGTSFKFPASHILKYLGGNKLINREANLKNLLD